MIGIKFEIPNNYNNYLEYIFDGIDLKNKKVNIVNSEVFKENGKYLFKNNIYSTIEFKNLIHDKKYYIVFLTLSLYDIDSKIEKIRTYEDYCNGNCNLLLIIVDNIFVDIYVKDKMILEKIKNNAKIHKFKNICCIKNKEEFKLYY